MCRTAVQSVSFVLDSPVRYWGSPAMCAVERLSARESNRACAMADVRCRAYRTVARSVQAAPLARSGVRGRALAI